jgi:hypothetical protein
MAASSAGFGVSIGGWTLSGESPVKGDVERDEVT